MQRLGHNSVITVLCLLSFISSEALLVLSPSSSVQDGFRDAGVLVQGQERNGVGEEIDLQQNSVHQVVDDYLFSSDALSMFRPARLSLDP